MALALPPGRWSALPAECRHGAPVRAVGRGFAAWWACSLATTRRGRAARLVAHPSRCGTSEHLRHANAGLRGRSSYKSVAFDSGQTQARRMEIAILFAPHLSQRSCHVGDRFDNEAQGALQKLIDEGDSGAAAAVKLGEDPTRSCPPSRSASRRLAYSTASWARPPLAGPWLHGWSCRVPLPHADHAATGLVVVVITHFPSWWANWCPSALASRTPNCLRGWWHGPSTCWRSPPSRFVILLSTSTLHRCVCWGQGDQRQPRDRGRDPRHAGRGHDGGCHRVARAHHGPERVRLDDRQIGSLMVPRATWCARTWMRRLKRTQRCRHRTTRGRWCAAWTIFWVWSMPGSGCAGSREHGHGLADQPLQAALYVPETITGMELLDNFVCRMCNMAFVIDEYGEVQGIVSAAGPDRSHHRREFQPRDPETSWAVQRGRKLVARWAYSGARTQDRLGTWTAFRKRARPLPHPERHADADGTPPKETDTVTWEGWTRGGGHGGKTIDKTGHPADPGQRAVIVGGQGGGQRT